MSRKWLAALVAAVVVASAFGAGYKVGSDNSTHAGFYTADCYTGAAVASCQVGDTTYGFKSIVNWTDSGGVGHLDGWPDCLPPLQEVKGVRFAGAWLPIGKDATSATVVWVDCQSH
jgi:hypothetical protein